MTPRPPSSHPRPVVVTAALTLVVLGALVLVSAALLPWAQAHSELAAGVGVTVQVGPQGHVRFPLDAAALAVLPPSERGAGTDLATVLAGSSTVMQLHQRWPQIVVLAGLMLGWLAGVLALAGLLRRPRVGLSVGVALSGLASVALVFAGAVQVLGLRQVPQGELGASLHAGLGAYLGVAGALIVALGGAGALILPGSVATGLASGRSGGDGGDDG